MNSACETTNRVGLYQFYSSIFLQEPDASTLELFQNPEWQSAFEELGVMSPLASPSVIDDLAVDFCQIFIGPQKAVPPIQSVWQSGQLQSNCIESMNRYLEFIQPATETSVKDHFGSQLEVMALILRALMGQSAEDSAKPTEQAEQTDLDSLAVSFFGDHIEWALPMIQSAAAKAETDFYNTVLNSCLEFVTQEKLAISALSDRIRQ